LCGELDFSSCKSLLRKSGYLQVVNTVEEIQERHDAVKEIEKKLLDLHQVCLHKDLSLEYLIQLIIIAGLILFYYFRFTLTWQS